MLHRFANSSESCVSHRNTSCRYLKKEKRQRLYIHTEKTYLKVFQLFKSTARSASKMVPPTRCGSSPVELVLVMFLIRQWRLRKLNLRALSGHPYLHHLQSQPCPHGMKSHCLLSIPRWAPKQSITRWFLEMSYYSAIRLHFPQIMTFYVPFLKVLIIRIIS